MGRARLPMKLIADEKKRRITFTKRWAGLKKKAYELTKLCATDAFIICSTPQSPTPSFWPPDVSDLHRIIARYQALPAPKRTSRTQTLPQFFTDMNHKLEKQLQHPKMNSSSTSSSWINDLPLETLRELSSFLDEKIEMMDKRIDSLIRSEDEVDVYKFLEEELMLPDHQPSGGQELFSFGAPIAMENMEMDNYFYNYNDVQMPCMANDGIYDQQVWQMMPFSDGNSAVAPLAGEPLWDADHFFLGF